MEQLGPSFTCGGLANNGEQPRLEARSPIENGALPENFHIDNLENALDILTAVRQQKSAQP